MTKPEVFYQNTLNSLEYLNKTLPPNSYVVFIGVVDGRILYNTLSNERHPLGATYKEVYNFLNCVGSVSNLIY